MEIQHHEVKQVNPWRKRAKDELLLASFYLIAGMFAGIVSAVLVIVILGVGAISVALAYFLLISFIVMSSITATIKSVTAIAYIWRTSVKEVDEE